MGFFLFFIFQIPTKYKSINTSYKGLNYWKYIILHKYIHNAILVIKKIIFTKVSYKFIL